MEAEKKLQGAKYHLQRMGEIYLINDQYFIYELEAFLVKVRSVPDVLLEDFNNKFSLGISLDEKLYPDTFKEKAEKLKNTQALDFIQWWENEKNQIKYGSLAFLFKKRNISVHRKEVKPDLIKIHIVEPVTVGIRGMIEVTKPDSTKITEEFKGTKKPPEPVKTKTPKIDLFFQDYPDKNVVEVCEEFLEKVKEFVKEAKSRFNN